MCVCVLKESGGVIHRGLRSSKRSTTPYSPEGALCRRRKPSYLVKRLCLGHQDSIFKRGLISGPVTLTASVGSLKTPVQQMNLSMKLTHGHRKQFLQLLPEGSEWKLVSSCRAEAQGTRASGAEAPGPWSSAAWAQLPSAWGTLPGLNPCPQHWQEDS